MGFPVARGRILGITLAFIMRLDRDPDCLARLDHLALDISKESNRDKVALAHNHHIALGFGPVQTDHLHLQCYHPSFPTLSVQFVTTAVTVVVSFTGTDSGVS